MKLINTDGMALLGPGSEWFWTMLQFIALAITFYAIYRQLRAQRSASVFEQMAAWHREWEDVRFTREKLVFLLEMEGREVADGLPRSGATVGNWCERLGYLVANGHLRSIDVWHDMRPSVGWWWALVRNEALKARYGKTTGTAFAGMVSGPNKLMRRIAKRDLITWDGAAGGYRIDPADAEIILANWD